MLGRAAHSGGSTRSRVLAAKNPANPPPTTTTDGRDAADRVMEPPQDTAGRDRGAGRAPRGSKAAGTPAARRSLDDERPVHLRVDAAVEGIGPGLRRRGEAAVPGRRRGVEAATVSRDRVIQPVH